MKVIISEQHLNRFPVLSKYAAEKVAKLSKFNPRILSVTIHLIAQVGHRGQEQDYTCQLVFDMPGNNLTIADTERAMDKAIDKVIERAKRQLVRSKEKTISRKHKEGEKFRNLP